MDAIALEGSVDVEGLRYCSFIWSYNDRKFSSGTLHSNSDEISSQVQCLPIL